MANFRRHRMDPAQLWLLPPSLDDLVGQDSEVRLLGEAVDAMDLTALYSSYSHTGRPAYDPASVVKVLLFAYSRGVRSSRRIAELVACDVRFMWLAKGDRPDFHTIARFRREKWELLQRVFAESVRLCTRAGLVLFESLSIDGTKIKANASRTSLVAAEELRAIEEILREAEAVDAEEDERFGEAAGRELPEGLKDPKERKTRLRQLLEELEKDQPKRVSATDPEARLMQTRVGVELCYNTQAAVDSLDQVVTAFGVVAQAWDNRQVLPMIEAAQENVGMLPDVVLADAGYSSEETLSGLHERGQQALIPSVAPAAQRDGDPAFAAAEFSYDPEHDALVCPKGRELHFRREHQGGSGRYRLYGATGCRGCSFYRQCVPGGKGNRTIRRSVIAELRDQMRKALATEEGQAVYAVRGETVEPVFGCLKQNLGFRRFLLRGLNGATAEAAILFTVHNVKKWMRWAREMALSRLSLGVSRLVIHLPPSGPKKSRRSALAWRTTNPTGRYETASASAGRSASASIHEAVQHPAGLRHFRQAATGGRVVGAIAEA